MISVDIFWVSLSGDIDVDQPFLDPQIFSPQKESVTLPPDGLFSTGGGL